MNNTHELVERKAESQEAVAYEAPRVESVITSEELEREVFYAGVIGGSQVPA